MAKIPEHIASGEPTRQQLGAYLEAGPEIRTPPASQAYRDNYDRIFGKKDPAPQVYVCGNPNCAGKHETTKSGLILCEYPRP